MVVKISKCHACEDGFRWDDNLIIVEEGYYHRDCVTLYPSGYVAFVGDEFLGETENEDGQMACEIVDDCLEDE